MRTIFVRSIIVIGERGERERGGRERRQRCVGMGAKVVGVIATPT